MCMVQGWDKAVDTVQEKGTNGAEEGKQENKKDEKRGKKRFRGASAKCERNEISQPLGIGITATMYAKYE